MSVRITQIDGHKFKAESNGVELVSGRVDKDSPYKGMSPGKLMVAALVLCTSMHIESYLSKEGIEHGGIEITVGNKYERAPPRTVEFTLDVKVEAELDEGQRKGIAEEAKRYYVGNTMRGSLRITVNLL